MAKTIEEIFPPKLEARLRVYADSIDDDAHRGLLKVGPTTRDVKQRVAKQLIDECVASRLPESG